MKIILTQEVKNLGEAGTIKEVANGYARNYLLPRGLAKPATAGAVKQIEAFKAAEAKRIAKLEEENKSLADIIARQSITITARVGQEGRLYGSVTAQDIAQELQKLVNTEIDRRKIELPENIHTTGDYNVTYKLVGKLNPSFKVRVVGENQETAPAQTEAPTAETTAETTEATEDTTADE